MIIDKEKLLKKWVGHKNSAIMVNNNIELILDSLSILRDNELISNKQYTKEVALLQEALNEYKPY